MKKRLIFAFLLAFALLALCACGPSAPTAADDTPAPAVNATADADAPAITMRQLLDANSADALFQTYANLLKTYQYPDAEDTDGYRLSEYHDADVILTDYGYEQDLLFRDGSSGYLYDDQGYAAILDMNFDPSFFAYPAFDETLTLQEEIDSVSQDGDAISLVTRLYVDAYRPYFPEDAFPYADGDYIEESYLVNAADFALLQDRSALVHADGSREEQAQIDIAYDVAAPEIVAELLARKNSPDFRTGTVTLDPNTEEERSASANAQKGDAIITIPPDGYALYLDPECVTPEDPDQAPDYNADFHLYAKFTEE